MPCRWDFGVSLVRPDDFLVWYGSKLRLKACVEPRDISVDRDRDDQSCPNFDWLSSFLHSCTLFSWLTLWNFVLMDDLLFWALGLTTVHPWFVSLDASITSPPSELSDLASTTLFEERGGKLFCNSSCSMKVSQCSGLNFWAGVKECDCLLEDFLQLSLGFSLMLSLAYAVSERKVTRWLLLLFYN